MTLLSGTSIPREPVGVVAVGCGIAGLAAALAAVEEGARVALLEKAPPSQRGGNTRFADAQIRFPHVADQYCARTYTAEQFRDDLMRLSRGRAHPELIDVLVRDAAEVVEWLSELGVEWEAGYPHTAGYRRALGLVRGRPSGFLGGSVGRFGVGLFFCWVRARSGYALHRPLERHV